MLSKCPRYFNHGPAAEMWSVVHLPFTLIRTVRSVRSLRPIYRKVPAVVGAEISCLRRLTHRYRLLSVPYKYPHLGQTLWRATHLRTGWKVWISCRRSLFKFDKNVSQLSTIFCKWCCTSQFISGGIEVQSTTNTERRDQLGWGDEAMGRRICVITSGEITVIRCDDGVLLAFLNVLAIPLTDAWTTSICKNL